MSPEVLISALITGIVLGGLYMVVAVGYSLIFGVIRVINLAHGSLLMLFMYAGFWLWYFFRLDPYVSILLVAPLAFACGYLVQDTLVRPMYEKEKSAVSGPLGVLLMTAGLGIVLQNVAMLVFKSDTRGVIVPYAQRVIRFGFLSLTITRLAMIGIAAAMVAALHWLLTRTELGTAIRAVGQNREAAAMCGVNIRRIYAITFGLGTAMLGIGGCAMLPFYLVQPWIGIPLGSKSSMIVVLGGLGSIPGAMLGAVIIGVVEAVGAQFVPATAASIFSLMLFLVVLFIRPKGLMGVVEA